MDVGRIHKYLSLLQLSKFDVKRKAVAAQWRVAGGAPLCECKFVARPGAEAEDDGVILAPAIDADGRTMVVVLDASNMSEIAKAYTPKPFAIGFHSTFIRS
jgi:carotenoid cleavage dioxygenase-like enzyme